MNQIHYFKTANRYVAVAPGQFTETITFSQTLNERYPVYASIIFQTGSFLNQEYYERVESGYSPSNYAEYVATRYKAQAATAEFFGEYEQFRTPPAQVDESLMQGFLAFVNK
ncbi:hypothetical protein GCM10027592_56420 [Spirosoma flavus]